MLTHPFSRFAGKQPVAARQTLFVCALALVATFFAAAEPHPAQAGEYTVTACEAASSAANHSWTQAATPGMSAPTNCPNDPSGRHAGIQAYAGVNAGNMPPFANAYSRFDAPAGTSIAAATLDYEFWRSDGHWFTGLQADDNRLLEGCGANDGNPSCAAGSSTSHRVVKTYYPDARSLRLIVACGDPAGCSTASTGEWPNSRAYSTIHSAKVVLNDPSPPAVAWAASAPTTEVWLSGPNAFSFTSTDNSGVSRTQLYIDGQLEADTSRGCDYSYTVPCANLPAGAYPVDTRTLTDGPHSIAVKSYDAAGNQSRLATTVLVDNTAPNEVSNPTVAGGESDWHTANSFTIKWTNPTHEASPVATAHYEIEDASGNVVRSGSQAGTGITALSNIAVPAPGDYTARIWVGDEAGNVNPANKSTAVHLRFDEVPPGEAVPESTGRWIGARDAGTLNEHIAMAPDARTPVSGIAGYSATTDGTEPDGSIDVTGADATYKLADLPEGTMIFKARAVSGAGIPSPLVGTARILVDRSPPTVATTGAPNPELWQPGPVSLTLTGLDQSALSDMTAAPAGQPAESGGHLAFSIDDGILQRTPGPVATPVVASDGDHVVAYQAFDAAGNPSVQSSVRVRVDHTPPERVVFKALDPRDPRTVRVVASDATSGIASGVIEIRAASSSDWRPLPASLSWDDTLTAQLDDVASPRGPYELRAIAWDRAGNATTGDGYGDGSPATVDTGTLRSETTVSVAEAPAVRVPFGGNTNVHGELTTSSGRPLVADVTVLAKLHAVGASYEEVDTVSTDSRGRFVYQAPPGGSRTLRFVYAGDARDRPAETDMSVLVPASSTIKASPHKLRVGDTVTLSGHLETLGILVPSAGKLLDMEAFDRGRWRKFATVRTNPNGSWSYRYRFVATHGTVTYPMRAVIQREAAYPFETGASKVVRVTVRGP